MNLISTKIYSINFQEGSVVSREVFKSETSTVTLFAFALDQGLSEHTTPFDAFAQILEGEAEITISGEPNTVKAGELIHMPKNQPHKLLALQPFKMLLVMIKR